MFRMLIIAFSRGNLGTGGDVCIIIIFIFFGPQASPNDAARL